MKKKFLLTILMATMGLGLVGCGNYNMLDMNYTFDRAIIKLQNGEVLEVEVKKWTDYDGEQLQIETPDGKLYLTSSYNCTLIKD